MTATLQEQHFTLNTQICDIWDALAWAESLAWEAAERGLAPVWLLAEAPERPVWRQFSKEIQPADLGHCQRLAIFSPEAELRLELKYGSDEGIGRFIWRDENAGATYARMSEYLLAGSSDRLQYAEHFAKDPESGALIFQFARFCGVRR